MCISWRRARRVSGVGCGMCVCVESVRAWTSTMHRRGGGGLIWVHKWVSKRLAAAITYKNACFIQIPKGVRPFHKSDALRKWMTVTMESHARRYCFILLGHTISVPVYISLVLKAARWFAGCFVNVKVSSSKWIQICDKRFIVGKGRSDDRWL